MNKTYTLGGLFLAICFVAVSVFGIAFTAQTAFGANPLGQTVGAFKHKNPDSDLNKMHNGGQLLKWNSVTGATGYRVAFLMQNQQGTDSVLNRETYYLMEGNDDTTFSVTTSGFCWPMRVWRLMPKDDSYITFYVRAVQAPHAGATSNITLGPWSDPVKLQIAEDGGSCNFTD